MSATAVLDLAESLNAGGKVTENQYLLLCDCAKMLHNAVHPADYNRALTDSNSALQLLCTFLPEITALRVRQRQCLDWLVLIVDTLRLMTDADALGDTRTMRHVKRRLTRMRSEALTLLCGEPQQS